jgi:hypothetical protein
VVLFPVRTCRYCCSIAIRVVVVIAITLIRCCSCSCCYILLRCCCFVVVRWCCYGCCSVVRPLFWFDGDCPLRCSTVVDDYLLVVDVPLFIVLPFRFGVVVETIVVVDCICLRVLFVRCCCCCLFLL